MRIAEFGIWDKEFALCSMRWFRDGLIRFPGWVNFDSCMLPFEVTKNITLLGSELFNLYLVKGETYAIVEGGVSGITYPFLDQLSLLNVPPEAISHLVILHSHFDHMMVFPTLKGRYPWMKIVSSDLNRPIFTSEKIIAKIFDSDRKMTLTLIERRNDFRGSNSSTLYLFPARYHCTRRIGPRSGQGSQDEIF